MKLILFVCIALMYSKADGEDPKGHFQPLGSHQPPEGSLKSAEHVPTPEYFFDNHILPGVPLLFKGAAKSIPAYSKWTDEYLSTKFGEINMDVEEGKKENRSWGTFNFKLQDFIRRYKNEDIYMVESLPQLMKEDYTLLRSLHCGGFTTVLQDAVVWFSSGGTKSVLHFDGVDNINCLFSGTKELILIDKKFSDQAHIDQPGGAFSSVDVDKVDMYKYPGFQTIPYYKLRMEEGDCFFIPYKWIHQVRSFGSRNLAVNIWWAHITKFNKTDCEKSPYKDKESVPLGDFEFRPSESTRQRFLEKMNEKSIDVEQFVNFLQEEALIIMERQILRTVLEERFKAIDKDKDGSVTPEEIYDIPADHVEQLLAPMLPEEDEDEDEQTEDADETTHEVDKDERKPASEHIEL